MRADRLVALLLLLQARGKMTAVELADELDVSERTIYRDIEALSIAGVPICTQSGSSGGVFLDEGYRVSLTGLKRDEVQALFASGQAELLGDLGLAKAAESTLLKLLAALPLAQRREAERTHQRIYIDPAGWFHMDNPAPHLPLLQQAVWEDREIDVTYRRGDGVLVERRLQAYGLVAKASIWYLVGGESVEKMRIFRVSRFQSIALTDVRFERDPAFDLAAYWKSESSRFASGYRLVFSARLRVAPLIYDLFPELFAGRFEVLNEPADGWLLISVSFGSFDEARTMILGMGAHAEVLEPVELRRSVIQQAQEILDFYREEQL